MKRSFPILLLVACAVTFVFGIVQLFKLRFEVGDVYPKYSSLRSDPLGTMAFYESIEQLPDFSVRRDYSAANRLPESKPTTYLQLAASPGDWNSLPESTFKEIEQFVTSGGRLAITLSPASANGYRSRFRDGEEGGETNSVAPHLKGSQDQKAKDEKAPPAKRSASGKPKNKQPTPEEEDLEKHWVSIRDRWGVAFNLVDLQRGDGDIYEPVRVENRSDQPLPESLEWHSGIVCSNLNAAWKTIYARGTNAVVIERQFGRGSVVIATDSYFVSNEAMLKDRHADLLAWWLGNSRLVVFDEAHLGVTESPGVATLLRKYRLHGLTGGLLLLAGLFIWKNSTSLAPPQLDEQQGNYVAGRDAASGFVNLLRRSIPRRDLLATCFVEWKRSAGQSGRYSAARLQQAETVFQIENALEAKERHPLRTYQEIHSVLETRNPEIKP